MKDLLLAALVLLGFCVIMVCGEKICLPLVVVILSSPSLLVASFIGAVFLVTGIIEKPWALICSLLGSATLTITALVALPHERWTWTTVLWTLPFALALSIWIYRTCSRFRAEMN